MSLEIDQRWCTLITSIPSRSRRCHWGRLSTGLGYSTSHVWSLLFGSGATSSAVGWLGLEEEYRLILTIDRVTYMKLIIRGTSNCATSRARQINGNDVGSSLSYASNLQITICGRSVTPVILFRSCRYHYFLMPSFVGA
jgi:hypothetical protein